jgi:hypothetical protein
MTSVFRHLRIFITARPALYFAGPFGGERRARLAVRRDTQIVIEGYPRSGNTFAAVAFQTEQPPKQKVRMAHHLHVAAQVVRACEWRLPVMLLIRKPDEAVVSRVIRQPALSAEDALVDYIGFYRAVLPLLPNVVVAPFPKVTSDFGGLVRQVNERFGTTFAVPVSSPEHTRRTFERIEKLGPKWNGVEGINESRIARPSAERSAQKGEAAAALTAGRAAGLVSTATDIYETIVSKAR